MTFDFSGLITREVNSTVNNGVSSVLKTFSTAVNTNLNGFITKGSEQILSSIGAPQAIRAAVMNINAGIVNAGVNAAGSMFNNILSRAFNSGTLAQFSTMDSVIAGMSANNPHATDLFHLNTLSGLVSSLNGMVSNALRQNNFDPSYDSPYATDIANVYTPKYGFMFMVQFVPNATDSGEFVKLFQNEMNLVVHKFERPKVEIEHEVVNLYNFRTQVPKNVKYGPASFTVHDDIKSDTLSVIVGYLRTISPIFNFPTNTAEGTGGMEFDSINGANFGTIQQRQSNAYGLYETDGPDDSLKTIFKEIIVYHVYDFGSYTDVYHFYNPKFTSITMDGFDMEVNKGNIVNFEFEFDGYYIEVQKQTNSFGPNFGRGIMPSAQYNIVSRKYSEPTGLTNLSIATAPKTSSQGVDFTSFIQQNSIASLTSTPNGSGYTSLFPPGLPTTESFVNTSLNTYIPTSVSTLNSQPSSVVVTGLKNSLTPFK
jgi:hypothetical protein